MTMADNKQDQGGNEQGPLGSGQTPVSVSETRHLERNIETAEDYRTRLDLTGNQYASPAAVELATTVRGVLDYIKYNKERINKDQDASGHVVIRHGQSNIELAHGLFARPKDNFRDQVTTIRVKGNITDDPELDFIRKSINETSYEPMDLSKLVRKHKSLFDNEDEWKELRQNLMNFSAKVQEVRENRHDDERGEMKLRFERVLQDVPEWSILVNVPLIKGAPPIQMRFVVTFDAGSDRVTAGLRNWDLEKELRVAKEKEIQNALTVIRTDLPNVPQMML